MGNNNKPDIGFEKELWQATNELLEAVADNKYKAYVLFLIFLKHLSDRYDMRREELESLVQAPSSDYHTTDQAEISYILMKSQTFFFEKIKIQCFCQI